MSNAPWPRDARLALSVVVNVEEGAEMSVRDGDKGPEPVDELGVALKIPIRNHANESDYHYGIRAGWPRVAAHLAKHDVTATFTAAARALERAPEIGQAIAAGGHEACSHGWRWVHQFSFDEVRERKSAPRMMSLACICASSVALATSVPSAAFSSTHAAGRACGSRPAARSRAPSPRRP